jgi:hypothetical protein
MIKPEAGSVVEPISVAWERRPGGRQRIGVVDVEGGAAFGGAFNEPTGPEALAAPPESIGKMSLGR